MVQDLERQLGLLAAAGPTSSLPGLEERILAVIAARQQPVTVAVALTFSSLALLIGVVGAVVPSSRANANSTVPFGVPTALAPSSLLLAGSQ